MEEDVSNVNSQNYSHNVLANNLQKNEQLNNIKKDEKHIVAFVCGLLSIIIFFLTPLVSIVEGIIAIVLGIKSRKKYGSKLGLTGFILGIIGISLSCLFYIIIFLDL